MRLLLVTQDFPPDVGGIQTYATELAARLAPRCASFSALAPRRPRAAAADQRFAFPVHRWPARPDLLLLPALAALPVLARTQRLDVAFHAQWSTAAASLLARRLTGYPRRVVIAAHGRELLFNPLPTPLDRLYDHFRRRVLMGADRLLPVSRYTAGLLEAHGVSRRRCTVLPNGTDPDRFHPFEAAALRRQLGLANRRVLLTVGRLVRRKGIDTVLRALPRLTSACSDLVYLVIGTGPDAGRLRALAHRLGVARRVRFLGQVTAAALPAYYNLCDLFALPAREAVPDVEGFGLVFLEAGACGKPVLGARTGGIPDAVLDGETGLLVPPDDPAALAEAARRILRDPAEARRLGEAGRQRVLRDANWRAVAGRVFTALNATLSCTSS